MKKRAIVWLSLVLTFTPVAFAHAATLGESSAPGEGMQCSARAKLKAQQELESQQESRPAPISTKAAGAV